MSGVQSSAGGGVIAQLEQQLEQMLMGKLQQDLQSDVQAFSKLLGGDGGDSSPSGESANSAPASYQDTTGSSAASTPPAASSPFAQAGSSGDLGNIQQDFGLLSTIEDAGKKLVGDNNPQSNEADRLGQEAGTAGKIENLIKSEMGLISHSSMSPSTASDPLLVNKTQV